MYSARLEVAGQGIRIRLTRPACDSVQFANPALDVNITAYLVPNVLGDRLGAAGDLAEVD
jgi:hypothetical protein